MSFYKIVSFLVLIFGAFLSVPEAFALDKFLALGTASANGVYYPVGKGICKMFNAGRDEHLARCSTEITGGSVYNVMAVKTGELDIALTRTDLAYKSFEGTGMFQDLGPDKELRTVMALYDNVVGVIAKKDLGLTSLDGLLGKRINIGNKGSGERTDADMLFQAMGWRNKDFSQVLELSGGEVADAFCRGDVEVLIMSMGVPSGFFDRMTNDCGGVFVEVSDKVIDTIRADNPFVLNATVPAGMYPSNPDGIKTFSAKVVLITSSRLHPDAIYHLTKSISEGASQFMELHPALAGFSTQNMFYDKNALPPFHEGAARSYSGNGGRK